MEPTDKLFTAIKDAAPSVEHLIVTAPTSEWAVVFLLGQLSAQGGFQFVKGSGAFPDCTLRVDSTEFAVELELRASQYIRHGHPMDGCDAVICWDVDTKLPIPTLALSKLFNKAKTPELAEIDLSGKESSLREIFHHLRTWITSYGISATPIPVRSETNTLTFLTGPRSLCSIQFCGSGSNEYVRFRFYKAALQTLGISAEVASAFQELSDGGNARYSPSKTEERLDLYPGIAGRCSEVTERLDIFLTHAFDRHEA